MTISIGHRSLHIASPSNLLLWLIAAFHMLLAATLIAVLFSVSPAAAADEDACTGHNILTDLKQSDAARYAEVVRRPMPCRTARAFSGRSRRRG